LRNIRFKKDVYGRDRAVLTTLDREFGVDEGALLSQQMSWRVAR
jgi:hypothetical protein